MTEDVDFYVDAGTRVWRPGRRARRWNGSDRRSRLREAGVRVIGVDFSPAMLASRGPPPSRPGCRARRPTPRRSSRAPRLRARPSRHLPVPVVASHGDRGREAARGPRGPRTARARTVASSSTSSRRAARTSRRRTAAGSSASPGSSSVRTGTRGREHSRSRALGDVITTFGLHWLSAPEWQGLLDEAGLEVEALYGWFDRRPYNSEEDMIFVCRARS